MFHNWYSDAAANFDGSFPHTSSSSPSTLLPRLDITQASVHTASKHAMSPTSSVDSGAPSDRSIDSNAPNTPMTEPNHDIDTDIDSIPSLAVKPVGQIESRPRRFSTSLLSQDGEQLQQILGDDESGTKLIRKYCCGGGCCTISKVDKPSLAPSEYPVSLPDNDAFRSLKLNLSSLSVDTNLTSVAELPITTASLVPLSSSNSTAEYSTDRSQPPSFVQPHPPYHIFSAPVYNARELTRPGAEKRTFHFDIDVTDYPDEGGVDFKVGGAIGICPPNEDSIVEDIFDRLGILKSIRDKPITLRTNSGRWPTIWGDDTARELTTTRRELLTWCSDLQSTPPTKQLLRVLAEYASDSCEAKILNYLCSTEGQGAFCDLRTGPHISLVQLLHAFPSSQPPLEALFSVLKQLMPRFYSLSNDPCLSSERDGLAGRRLIEIAVSIHDTPDWRAGKRTGVGSGYLERIALQFISGTTKPGELRVPLFRGLMANPLTREFTSDGPMLLIGAGVGMAPFRGFILNRLKRANCANKVWLLQGVRDSSLDELYRGELGDHEQDVKRVVQSRRVDRREGEAKYVQEEVINQADIVWNVVNSVDGRVFVCGSSKGMGEGVWDALVRAAMIKGNMNRGEAEKFWKGKEDSGQYIAETW